MTLPKELHVPLVRLDGEVELGPAVFVCLSVCVCASVCVCVLVHLRDAHILASLSILHMYSESEFIHKGEKAQTCSTLTF